VNSADTSWQQPAIEQTGFRRFVGTLRERAILIAVVTLVTVGVGAIYVATADDVYEARTDVLVSPVPASDLTLLSLGLITESTDPTVAVETAAALIDTHNVAVAAQKDLGTTESVQDVQNDIEVNIVGQTNVVEIVARQPNAKAAADLANAFASAVITQRHATLTARINQVLPGLRAREASLPASDPSAQALGENVAELEGLRASGDPTLKIVSEAQPPDSRAWPRPALTIILTLIAGLLLGFGAAYAIQVLDPRLRREEQLRAMYRLPILVRIPEERGPRRDAPLAWDRLSVNGVHAFRALRMTLTAPRADGEVARSFLVTGASPSEGKTTTAINFATALARTGARVLLIEADLHRPSIGKALGVSTDRGVVSVVIGESEIADVAVAVPSYVDNLHLLLAELGLEELFSPHAAERLIEEAKREFDFVVIDSPPLTEVVDALPIARKVDEVIAVVRLGKSRLRKVKELGELLALNDVRPAGFVVMGTRPERGESYYGYGQPGSAGRQAPSRAGVPEGLRAARRPQA
jgi:capsular exopolysaccharide synthesis family protein